MKATRRRTKKRMLREISAGRTHQSSSPPSSLDPLTTDDAIDFASAGERKRMRLYAHQRKKPAVSLSLNEEDCRLTAHRCAIVSSRETQIALLKRELNTLRKNSENPRITPKVVVFVASLKNAKRVAPMLGKTNRVAFIDTSIPGESDTVIEGFRAGKIHTIVMKDEPFLIAKLYDQRNSIVATFAIAPPLSRDDFLGRSILPGAAARGMYGDSPLSASLLLHTSSALKSAKLMMTCLKNMGPNVTVSSAFKEFAEKEDNPSGQIK